MESMHAERASTARENVAFFFSARLFISTYATNYQSICLGWLRIDALPSLPQVFQLGFACKGFLPCQPHLAQKRLKTEGKPACQPAFARGAADSPSPLNYRQSDGFFGCRRAAILRRATKVQ